ncbi:Hypothetical predicted protein [Octopus vulgaris]|uniref:Uncharacterized protein n=1 Tax=Octopus vulgaris TaxID=6645 RepID=A0AA36ANZ0_OCTVU|nr:Hypothetical predicted protein [Octopus vulgaris]
MMAVTFIVTNQMRTENIKPSSDDISSFFFVYVEKETRLILKRIVAWKTIENDVYGKFLIQQSSPSKILFEKFHILKYSTSSINT